MPIVFGVLTVFSLDQARERAESDLGRSWGEAALSQARWSPYICAGLKRRPEIKPGSDTADNVRDDSAIGEAGARVVTSDDSKLASEHEHRAAAEAISQLAYNVPGLVLVQAYDQGADGCTSRGCQNYDPSQMWYVFVVSLDPSITSVLY